MLGYDLRSIKRSDTLDLHLRRYFAAHATDLVIDCGAHKGDFAALCRWAGYRGRIISFEPTSTSYQACLAKSARDPLWQVEHMAVGAAAGEATLNISAGSDFNSILAASDDMAERFGELAGVGTETVTVSRLDEILADRRIAADAKIFLKTDTQGYDLEVLQGAGDRINQIAAILVEMAVQPIYQHAPSHWDMMDYVRAKGYELYASSSISRDTKGGLIEYDAIWKRVSERAGVDA
jgi:FkbM family methyltransferase